MTDNVSKFPTRDLIAEMKGPSVAGNAVIIDGRLVPNLVMIERDDEIDFVLDNRLSFSFPRELAWLAASFAFSAMAIGAGFPGPAGKHKSQRDFGRECIHLNEIPS